jgi:hypothetical protein
MTSEKQIERREEILLRGVGAYRAQFVGATFLAIISALTLLGTVIYPYVRDPIMIWKLVATVLFWSLLAFHGKSKLKLIDHIRYHRNRHTQQNPGEAVETTHASQG